MEKDSDFQKYVQNGNGNFLLNLSTEMPSSSSVGTFYLHFVGSSRISVNNTRIQPIMNMTLNKLMRSILEIPFFKQIKILLAEPLIEHTIDRHDVFIHNIL